MASDNHTYTKTGLVRRALYAQICSWVSIAWEKITTETIINGFRHEQLILGNIKTSAMIRNDSNDKDDEDDFDGKLNSEMEIEDFDGF